MALYEKADLITNIHGDYRDKNYDDVTKDYNFGDKDKNDASAQVRSVNKEAMKKYMAEAPWGIGLTIGGTRPVPENNK